MNTVYVWIGNVWVSGEIERTDAAGNCLVRLCTGSEVVRHRDELRDESPRLSDNRLWPV